LHILLLWALFTALAAHQRTFDANDAFALLELNESLLIVDSAGFDK
jgi:hypothetical protein